LPSLPSFPLEPDAFASPAVAVGHCVEGGGKRVSDVGINLSPSPGDEEEPVPPVRGADGLRWHTIPDRIVPALAKVSEYDAQSSNKER
jgi:hypothetical protein